MLISDRVDSSSIGLFFQTPLALAGGTSQQRVASAGHQPSASSCQRTSTACFNRTSNSDVDRDIASPYPQGRNSVFLFGGTLSPADLLYLDEILTAHGLDGSIMAGVDHLPNEHRLPMPIGMARTDEFFQTLTRLGSSPTRPRFKRERERLVMRLAGTDMGLNHRRVGVHGHDIDFVVGIVSLLLEAGMLPVLCASCGDADRLRRCLELTTPELPARTPVVQALQLSDLLDQIPAARPDVLIASRDASCTAQCLGIPLVCAGRSSRGHSGGERIVQIGYLGALQLLDRLQMALHASSN